MISYIENYTFYAYEIVRCKKYTYYAYFTYVCLYRPKNTIPG